MPALGGSQRASRQYLDHSGERQSVTIPVGELTALTLAGFLTQLGAWNTALDAVTLGTPAKDEWSALNYLSNTRPASANAQIETRMLVTYMNATTEAPFSFIIPTVDYAAFNYADPPAGDVVIITDPGWSAATEALIEAFEAVGKAPDNDTQNVVITGMRVVR